ncbi:MAG: response regulator [Lachnospiraceae bacterium]
MYKVMLVEDDEVVRYVYSRMRAWGDYGFTIAVEVGNGARALEELRKEPVDAVFTDIRMPLMDGIEFMKQVHTQYPDLSVIFVTSYDEFSYAREGLRLGAFDYLIKPLTEEDLGETLQRLQKKFLVEEKSGMEELFLRIFSNAEMLSDPLIKQVADYLYEGMKENRTLEQLAEALDMNRDYLGKQIKKKTGFSFRDLYQHAKVEYAKPLIVSGQYKMYEISELLGYASPDYFSNIFKKVTSFTPAQFKKMQKSDL